MSIPHDEFDLDVRFPGTENTFRGAIEARGLETVDTCVNTCIDTCAPTCATCMDTCAPQATCPAETCGLDCLTQTCPEATCGCDTSETCNQVVCSDAITLGVYCRDETDETCGCQGGNSADCGGPPDSLGCPPSDNC